MTGDEGQIRAKRDAAARARRLARQVTQDDIRRRMQDFADALDAEADAIERRVQKPLAPQVTQMQMQVQQGPPAEGDPEKDKD